MQPDYPAAHSMDTMFFAVDRDGNVAIFSTGEAGAAPSEGLAGDQAFDVSRQLENILPRGDVIHDLDGRRMPGADQAPWRLPRNLHSWSVNVNEVCGTKQDTATSDYAINVVMIV